MRSRVPTSGCQERLEGVPRRALSAAQVLESVRADHHHGGASLEEAVDNDAFAAWEAPLLRRQDASISQLSLIGTPSRRLTRPWYTALSTITASRVTTGPCSSHGGTQTVERAGQ